MTIGLSSAKLWDVKENMRLFKVPSEYVLYSKKIIIDVTKLTNEAIAGP